MHRLKLAAHERFDLHELIVFKSLCATKASAMTKFVQDDELRTLMDEAFSSSQDQLRDLANVEQFIQDDDNSRRIQ